MSALKDIKAQVMAARRQMYAVAKFNDNLADYEIERRVYRNIMRHRKPGSPRWLECKWKAGICDKEIEKIMVKVRVLVEAGPCKSIDEMLKLEYWLRGHDEEEWFGDWKENPSKILGMGA